MQDSPKLARPMSPAQEARAERARVIKDRNVPAKNRWEVLQAAIAARIKSRAEYGEGSAFSHMNLLDRTDRRERYLEDKSFVSRA